LGGRDALPKAAPVFDVRAAALERQRAMNKSKGL
jgi:hypothetical protein